MKLLEVEWGFGNSVCGMGVLSYDFECGIVYEYLCLKVFIY